MMSESDGRKKNQTNLDLAVFKEGEPIRDFRWRGEHNKIK